MTPVQNLGTVFNRCAPLFQSGATCRLLGITVKRFIPLGLGEKLCSQNKTLSPLFGGYLIFISKYVSLCNKITRQYESNVLFETNFIIQICLVKIFLDYFRLYLTLCGIHLRPHVRIYRFR
jgi:hypothetical protein